MWNWKYVLLAAFCDVTPYLKCYSWAVKECQRYGEKWNKKWAHEPTLIRVSAEIPEIMAHHATPVNSELYPTWDKFLQDFLKRGNEWFYTLEKLFSPRDPKSFIVNFPFFLVQLFVLVLLVLQWNFDITWCTGLAKCDRYNRGSLYRGSFPYILLLIGSGISFIVPERFVISGSTVLRGNPC